VAFEIGMTAAEYYDSTPAEIGEKPRAAEQASALLSKLKEMNAQLGGEIY